jgi:16S rRNA (adenine1518-N6/adenine1519-N6)-dimethyltransferase
MHSIPLPGPGDRPADVISRPEGFPASPPRAPSEIRTLLKSLGFAPQKGFGQNFLIDDHILDRIVQAGEVGPGDVILEIGPGLGHLTHHLAPKAGEVIAVEIDRGFIRRLRQIFQGVRNVAFLEQDALKLDPDAVVGGRPFKIIANLPYYITSPAIRHFLEEVRRPTLMVIMVQQEVAERMIAPAGDLNLLAISVQIFGRPSIVTPVPAAAFYPRPNVDSAVVKIEVYDQPRITTPPAAFFKVVSAGFAMRRKQLHNSLAQRLWMPPGSAPTLLQEAGIDPARRPHMLTIDDWDRLTRVLLDHGLVQ